jgi:hypothetical protein
LRIKCKAFILLTKTDSQDARRLVGFTAKPFFAGVRPEKVDLGSEQGLSEFETGGITGTRISKE